MKTDIAALSASVVAVSVAIFGPQGYYDALGVALSLTLVFLFSVTSLESIVKT